MNRWPNFSEDELKCSHCGKLEMDVEFMDHIQELRTWYGKPMIVTSAYRCPDHPIEKAKETPGEHAQGLAIDIHVPTPDFLKLSSKWHSMGYERVGWNPGSFIHFGGSKELPQTIWVYS